jgi:hypothetical protein
MTGNKSEKETMRSVDDALKRAFQMPHKPQKKVNRKPKLPNQRKPGK